jgi:N utilization substance protein A
MKLSHVVEELVEERGLNREVLTSIVCEGLRTAYERKYPGLNFEVDFDKKTGELSILVHKQIVSSVEDDLSEISLRKARVFDANAQLGNSIVVPFEGTVGRIEILRAKQVIAQRIRSVESQALYEEFKPKEGTIISGSVYKNELYGATVKVGDALAFLPKSLMIPGDVCTPGHTLRALLKEVLLEPKNDNQLILDRKSPEFLVELFRTEIPEVYDGLVEIKKIARIAGYKSKIVVTSRDSDVDPVGTCIGFGGARIKPILRELGAEKIDILGESFSTEDFVRQALKPAEIRRVLVKDGTAQVWLDSDQRSLAIGKMGQNISLASQLCGLDIQLVEESPTPSLPQVPLEKEEAAESGNAEHE